MMFGSLWMCILLKGMIFADDIYHTLHIVFLSLNLVGLYSVSLFHPEYSQVYWLYSLWCALWLLYIYLAADIHHFFRIPVNKLHITMNRLSVISHISGCVMFWILSFFWKSYENTLFWFSFIYFYNDVIYLLIYEFKPAHLTHHFIVMGSFYLWTTYPLYGKECLEILLVLEKGNFLYTIWDWTRTVGIKSKIGFSKYMTYSYIFVRVFYLSYKVFLLIPQLWTDTSMILYHRIIGITFTIFVYIGSLIWSWKLYCGYKRLVIKTILERSISSANTKNIKKIECDIDDDDNSDISDNEDDNVNTSVLRTE